MSNALIPYSDIERIGNVLAKSKLFGMKTPEEAIALCLIAQAEGKHPATAAQEYHVIQGRPALKADAMLARFQAAGGKVNWLSYTDTEVSGEFSHPQGGSVKIDWSIAMAKKLGYDSKDNWKKFPRAMMRARCISEGVRTVYPGIAVGIYTPEEVQDFDNGKVIDAEPHDPITGEINAGPSIWKTATLRNAFTKNVQESFKDCLNEADLKTIAALNKEKLDAMASNGDSRDTLAVESIRNAYSFRLQQLKTLDDPLPDNLREGDYGDEVDMDRAMNTAMDRDGPPEGLRMKGAQ